MPAKIMNLTEALALTSQSDGRLSVPFFQHGSLVAEIYTPVGSDLQKPHSRDEIYVVARGSGIFRSASAEYEVKTGSFLFVPAGDEHRFMSFTDDFAVWVFFYGPEGGEVADRLLS